MTKRKIETDERFKRSTDRPCIAIETRGDNQGVYWFKTVLDLATAYDVSSMKVLRSIEDGRPINAYGVYVDYSL